MSVSQLLNIIIMNDGLPEHRKYKHHDITQTSIAPTTKQFSCHREQMTNAYL